MWDLAQNIGVVFNGEIYNHLELRRRLQDKGHVFHTSHSDTEVLIYGYREWGAQLPEHLNGCSPSPSSIALGAVCFWPAIGSAKSHCFSIASQGGLRSPVSCRHFFAIATFQQNLACARCKSCSPGV